MNTNTVNYNEINNDNELNSVGVVNNTFGFDQKVLTPRLTFDSPEKYLANNPFPINTMTPVLASCIRYIGLKSGLSDGMIIGPFLTSVSCALIPCVEVMTFYGKKTGVNLFIQTNAPASSRKTDMFNPFFQAIYQHDSDRREAIKKENIKIRAKIKTWKIKIEALKRKYNAATKHGDEALSNKILDEINNLFLEEPQLVLDLRIWQSDATPAAIIQGLQTNGNCNTFLLDEGVLLYNKIVNNEVHHINSAWSGASIDKTTIRNGNIHVKAPRLSLHTFIQPEVFSKIIRGKSSSFLNDTGFFTRMLVCEPKPSSANNLLPEFIGAESDMNNFLITLKSQLLISYPYSATFPGLKRTFTLSTDAKMLISTFYDQIKAEMSLGGIYHDIAGYCGKLLEQVYRLSALISFIEDPKSDSINYNCVSAAILLATWYVNEHWRLIAKGAKPIPVEEGAEKLLHFLRVRKDRHTAPRVSFNELRHRVEHFHDDPDFLDDCVDFLHQRGEIDVNGSRRKGRRGGYRRYDVSLSFLFNTSERFYPPVSG